MTEVPAELWHNFLKRHKMTLTELAKLLRFERRAVQRWKNEKRPQWWQYLMLLGLIKHLNERKRDGRRKWARQITRKRPMILATPLLNYPGKFESGEVLIYRGLPFYNYLCRPGATAIVEFPAYERSNINGVVMVRVRWVRDGLDNGQADGGYLESLFETADFPSFKSNGSAIPADEPREEHVEYDWPHDRYDPRYWNVR